MDEQTDNSDFIGPSVGRGSNTTFRRSFVTSVLSLVRFKEGTKFFDTETEATVF